MALIALKHGASYTVHFNQKQYRFTTIPQTITDRKVIDACKKINLLVVSDDEPPAPKAAPELAKRKPGNPAFMKKAAPKQVEQEQEEAPADDEQG